MSVINLYPKIVAHDAATIKSCSADIMHFSEKGHLFLGKLLHDYLLKRPELFIGRGSWTR